MARMSHLGCLCLALGLAAACDNTSTTHSPPLHKTGKRLIILGIDGMDPDLVHQYMGEGRLPNLKKLSEQGGFMPLGTSNPPQSPVAWSNFITGHTSSFHGIYDFVHRDPVGLSPYLSTSKATPPGRILRLGDFAIPLEGAKVELLREGLTFWEHVDDHGVEATVFKVPANFPPDEHWRSRTLAGMGTPDLHGTYGTFQLFTNNPDRAGIPISGGKVHAIDFGDGQRAKSKIVGPPDPFDATGKASLTVDIQIIRDTVHEVVAVEIGGHDAPIVLTPGDWTGWISIEFPTLPLVDPVAGMIRLHLRSAEPDVELYVSPLNIDPIAPAMPISSPRGFAGEVAARTGRYYTQGMPEDTKALAGEVLSDAAFLEQAWSIFRERRRLMRDQVEQFDDGVLFFYFSSIDQVCHVFWRAIKPDAPPALAPYAHAIRDFYEAADEAVGEVMKTAGEGTDIWVMSDHGFAPFDRKVHLNTWLEQQGWLALAPEGQATAGVLGHIDWTRTQAYALGLNQLFLNLEGRESAGVVPDDDKAMLIRRIRRALLAWRDPETGSRVVTRVEPPPAGTFGDRAPDLLVGYNRGYRSSDESAMGRITDDVLEDNDGVWSGDHCMDPALVPGVFFSNRPVTAARGSLVDMAPTILRYFDITPPDDMPGRDLFGPAKVP